ncbi:hypothetical protein [Cronobacter sp. JZ38]|uniref:hypothetical protein n=1 Tax=Cronobacter sp. JZ38 TaxID=1906275 RepID=UPI0012A1437D|nr:hypothetical protein [Cronobacter sp. JZ38]
MTVSKTDFSKIPSISGNNMFSLKCEEVLIRKEPTRASYTVCQHTILAFKEGRLPPGSFSECVTAIRGGKCKALKMMVEEVRAGESLYFEDYGALIAEVAARNNQSSFGGQRKTKSAMSLLPSRKSKAEDTTKTGEFEAITDLHSALVQEENT